MDEEDDGEAGGEGLGNESGSSAELNLIHVVPEFAGCGTPEIQKQPRLPVPRYMPETQTAQTSSTLASSMSPPTQCHNGIHQQRSWSTRSGDRKSLWERKERTSISDGCGWIRKQDLLTDEDEEGGDVGEDAGHSGHGNPSWKTWGEM